MQPSRSGHVLRSGPDYQCFDPPGSKAADVSIWRFQLACEEEPRCVSASSKLKLWSYLYFTLLVPVQFLDLWDHLHLHYIPVTLGQLSYHPHLQITCRRSRNHHSVHNRPRNYVRHAMHATNAKSSAQAALHAHDACRKDCLVAMDFRIERASQKVAKTRKHLNVNGK
jgi:hypothetical protein